jgi:hypothetical protein
MKKGLKLFWFSTGKDDFLVNNTQATVDLFKKARIHAGCTKRATAGTPG